MSHIIKKLYLLFGWIFLIVISLPIFFNVKIWYGDLLFIEQVVIDLVDHGGKWSGWSMTPSPAYFPDLLVYLLSYFFLNHAMDRVLFLSISEAILIVLSSWYLVKPLLKHDSLNLKFIFLMLMSVVSYSAYSTNMWMYYNGGNNHLGSLILTFVSLGVLVRAYRKPGINLAFLALTIILGFVNGRMFIVWFIIPTILLLLILLVFKLVLWQKKNAKIILLLLLITSISAILAIIIEPYITTWDSLLLLRNTDISIHAAKSSIINFGAAIFDLVKTPIINFKFIIYIWVLSILISLFCLIKLGLAYFFFRYNNSYNGNNRSPLFSLRPGIESKEDCSQSTLLILLFITILIPSNFIIVMVTGQFWGADHIRYFIPVIMLPIIMLNVILANYFDKIYNSKSLSLILICSSFTFLIFFIANFESEKVLKLSIADIRNHKLRWEKELTDCIDTNSEKYSLKYGVSDFWRARPITLLSKKELRVYPLNFNSIKMRHYMSNIDWFFGSNGYKYSDVYYNFAVTSPYDMNEEAIIHKAGSPSRSFECPHVHKILVYDDDTLDKVLRSENIPHIESLRFGRGEIDYIKFPGSYLSSFISRKPSKAVNDRKSAPKLITYGPYLYLKPGTYEATINYETPETEENINIGNWDLVYNSGKNIVDRGVLLSSKTESFRKIHFKVGFNQRKKLFEIRTWSNGKGNISVKSIEIKRKK